MSNKPEYLKIQHLPGPVGAVLKELYCIKPSHICVQVACINKGMLIRNIIFFENRSFFRCEIFQDLLLYLGIPTTSLFTVIS